MYSERMSARSFSRSMHCLRGWAVFSFLGCVFLPGCTKVVYPVTTGSHAPYSESENKPHRYVVWATHPALSAGIVQFLQVNRQIVVERSRLESVFTEQRLRLTHTADDEAQLLRVGKLIGAERIIFADHTINHSYLLFGGDGGDLVSVRVRAVDVESGEVKWSGSAWYPKSVANVEDGIARLTSRAIWRALCPIEQGYTWTESSASNDGGCSR